MMNVIRNKSSWVEQDTKDNATATASKAAPSSGLRHFITGVGGGYDAAVAGNTLILKDGSTEVARWLVHNSFSEDFNSPIELSPATAANLELEASGSGGTNGSVVLKGYTL